MTSAPFLPPPAHWRGRIGVHVLAAAPHRRCTRFAMSAPPCCGRTHRTGARVASTSAVTAGSVMSCLLTRVTRSHASPRSGQGRDLQRLRRHPVTDRHRSRARRAAGGGPRAPRSTRPAVPSRRCRLRPPGGLPCRAPAGFDPAGRTVWPGNAASWRISGRPRSRELARGGERDRDAPARRSAIWRAGRAERPFGHVPLSCQPGARGPR